MTLNIKKGDQVVVLAGKDRKQKGKVIHTMPKANAVIVEGVNIVVKHQKPRQSTKATPQTQTGRIEKPAPLNASKVMVICPSCSQPTRIGHVIAANGKSVRSCKKCGKMIDVV